MSKRSLPEMPKKKILLTLCVILIAAAVGISQPLSWPGGWGIGKEKSVTTTTIEKDGKGNITKSVEMTKIDDGKTLWDWLSLLGVPLSLAVLGYVLQQLQQKRAEILAKEQREIAAEETKEEVLQVYFDRLSGLLVDKNLLAIAAKGDQAKDEDQQLLASSKDVIRARTLSILRRFKDDPERKTSVILFLIEADFISKLKLDLSRADLRDAKLLGADLSSANLKGADLRGTKLLGADLSDADLRGAKFGSANLSCTNLMMANLSDADLRGANLGSAKLFDANLFDANLRGTYLSGADFSNANLLGADLLDANLMMADLRSAKHLTDEQLDTAKLCKTLLPEGFIIPPDRDCKALRFREVDPGDFVDTEDLSFH
jgi:uncharacterized protein YjbI with pentapeptide repeats